MTSWEKEKALRLRWSKSMKYIAEVTGISLDHLKYAEQRCTPMTLHDAVQLSKYFGKPIEYFLDD